MMTSVSSKDYLEMKLTFLQILQWYMLKADTNGARQITPPPHERIGGEVDTNYSNILRFLKCACDTTLVNSENKQICRHRSAMNSYYYTLLVIK